MKTCVRILRGCILTCFILTASAVGYGLRWSSRPPDNQGLQHVLSAQIMLDRAGFSPGELDGHWGHNAQKALRAFQKTAGLDPTGKLDSTTSAALEQGAKGPAWTNYTITEADARGAFIAEIPSDMMKKARLPAMSYTSIYEELAERFHIKPELLRKLNEGTEFRPGQTITVPNVTPMRVPEKGESGKDENRGRTEAKSQYTIVVSKNASTLDLLDSSNRIVFHAPVTSGSQHDPLPLGDWKVTAIEFMPPFRYNPNLFWDAKSTDEKTRIQPGPNNPVGLVWIDISKEHYGIHGTPEPGKIGYTESHGCVRLTNWDALKLASMVGPGTPVLFRP